MTLSNEIQTFLHNIWDHNHLPIHDELGEILDPGSWNTPRVTLETWWYYYTEFTQLISHFIGL